MKLFNIEHTKTNGEVIIFELIKDECDRLWFYMSEDSGLYIEIPVTKDMILDMFVSSRVTDCLISKEFKTVDLGQEE